ncbi:hypothetical protein SGLAM104S_07693 [Streptomyces glaucescens]
MHYTGMLAVRVRVTPSGDLLPGATAMQFVFPSPWASAPTSS